MTNHETSSAQPESLRPRKTSADKDISIKGLLSAIRRHPVATAVTATVATATAGVAITANVMRGPADGAPAPVGTPTAEPSEPGASPTPTETEVAPDPANPYEFGIEKSTVDALIAPGQEALFAQPIETRMDVSLYFAQEELSEFSDLYNTVATNSGYNPNKLVTLLPPNGMTADSSLEEVRAYIFHMQNIAISRAQADNYTIDSATGKAILAGITQSAQSPTYINLSNYIDKFAAQQQTADAESVNSARSLATGGRVGEIEIVEGSTSSGTDDQNRPFHSWTEISQYSDGTAGAPTPVTARWTISKSGIGGWVAD